MREIPCLLPHSVTETRRYRLFEWTMKYIVLIAENILSMYSMGYAYSVPFMFENYFVCKNKTQL